ncbi:MAG: nucleotidyltransferase domain-containing protein [Lawsonibacter sp.]|nr:nucleotidyltransferase domain-containing protein [Lawsonibacter sp.]
MSIQLPDSLAPQLAALARRHGAQRLVLFGSRARGDNRERSDIDLAVYGMPQANQSDFWLDAEELPTLLKLDIVHIIPGMDPNFLRNIEKDGVTIYAED